jgi:predicted ABC-type ATPase
MKIKESHLRLFIRRKLIESKFTLTEGPHDPGRFKAIFMAGCPGSGKGTVLRGIFGSDSGTTHHGLKIVNPDELYELLLIKSGLGLSQPDLPEDDPDLKAYQSAAGRLQYRAGMKMTGGSGGISPGHVGLDPHSHGYNPAKKQRGASRLETYIQGGLGLVIDGTASNYEQISREKLILEDLGYSTMMIAVNVPVEVALERNKQRGSMGKRSIHPGAVRSSCERLIPNLERYSSLFGNQYVEIDNTLPVDQTLTAVVLSKINRFISDPTISTGARDPDSDADDAAELRDIANDIENQKS